VAVIVLVLLLVMVTVPVIDYRGGNGDCLW
jgi:hypothetical protein